ncbi:MAG: translocation/assembly module TamB domain-containing protein, partial [Pseudomonadota bacterium]
WGADVRIRGTTAAPRILGRADLVRGGYEFAGKRFEMTKGIINFDGNSPPDPRLDIAATAEITGLTATVRVTGTAFSPLIAFTSVPSLPEEELLSRLLFGSSITQISAPEAVQIGAALASLRGGGGLDPINKLRSAIGLDRLRIVGADTATGRGTSVAVGKYISRRLYAEIVSDGRGYNATLLEYRVTRWLSILATVSSIGRQGVDVKISKDY